MTFSPSKVPFRWRLTALMAIAAALNGGDRAALSSMIPPVRDALGLSDLDIGLSGSAFLWCYALAAPISGILADRFSRTRILRWSVGLWSLVTVFTGLANGLVVLLAMRSLLGVTESFFLPAAFGLTAVHHPPTVRARAITVLSIGNHLGVIVGGAFAGLVAETYGWRLSFVSLGAMGIIWVGLALLLTKHRPEIPVDVGPADSPPQPRATEAFACLIRIPSYLTILFSVMLAGVAVWIFFTWLPLFLRDTFHLKLAAAGFEGFLVMQAPPLFGLAAGGWLSDKVALRADRNRMLLRAVGYLACAPFLLLFLTTPTLGVVLGGLGVFSFIRSVADANEIPIICDVVPPHFRSTAFGVLSSSITISGGAGVLAAGIFKKYFGLDAVFASLAVLFLLAGAAMLVAHYIFMPRDLARARARDAGIGALAGIS